MLATRTVFSLLSLLPVRGRVALDRPTMGRAMALAPLVGLVLGGIAAVVTAGFQLLTKAPAATPEAPAGHLLPAAIGIAALALLTRGLHLDGLADVADGIGAGRERALAAMRDSRLGAFGALALIFVVLVQVAALSLAIGEHRGSLSILVAAMTGRLAATLACTGGIPAAHPNGLGALVAGSVRPRQAVCSVLAVLTVAAGAGLLGVDGLLDVDVDGGGGSPGQAARAVAAVAVGTAAGWLLRRYLVGYLGGITGDVLGALVEITATVTLVFMALGVPTI
ncbi:MULTISPECIES: adenosylcobinamide-GDP ribazoletransferase [Protofrankia]|uniref:Adenosylcobinamide-GDP ribazoletransferase n=1 Tax=Candidatus Protofrankia datiscae TaxID=2716812 RepID=F8AZ54_9ACTN|nr:MULTISPECIES: adenosylcobinamide-GDP ribazoletransferase [Protofrankia]AEH10521.1 Cobalamin synthase [Candidatus Protofrankia datiscae]